MRNCAITLDHLGYRYDPETSHTVEGISRFLPSQVQSRWSEQVESKRRGDRRTKASDLTDILDQLARVADSRFCSPARSSSRRTKASTSQPKCPANDHGHVQPWTSTHAISQDGAASSEGKSCGIGYKLLERWKFIKASVTIKCKNLGLVENDQQFSARFALS